MSIACKPLISSQSDSFPDIVQLLGKKKKKSLIPQKESHQKKTFSTAATCWEYFMVGYPVSSSANEWKINLSLKGKYDQLTQGKYQIVILMRSWSTAINLWQKLGYFWKKCQEKWPVLQS